MLLSKYILWACAICFIFSGCSGTETAAATKGFVCQTCQTVVGGLHSWVTSNTSTEFAIFFFRRYQLTSPTAMNILKALFRPICRSFVKYQSICEYGFDGLIGLWISKGLSFLNPEVLCYNLNLCRNYKVVKDINKDYVSKTLRNRPPRHNSPRLTTFSSQQNKAPIRFVLFTDIHVDYSYQEVCIFPRFLFCC